MKLKYCIVLFFTAVLSSFYAQNPESFNYQFVIRDISGKIITNTSLNITFQIAQQKTNNVIFIAAILAGLAIQYFNLMERSNQIILGFAFAAYLVIKEFANDIFCWHSFSILSL